MATDGGSRHAPGVTAALATAPGSVTRAELSDAQRGELAWLCGLVGCAVPGTDAGTSNTTTAAPSSSVAPLLRVALRDGRVYTGRLSCVDGSANLVLSHAAQEAGVIDGVRVGGFAVGNVLVAWKHVLTVQRQKED